MLNYFETLRLRALHTSMRKIELSLKSSHYTISEFSELADSYGCGSCRSTVAKTPFLCASFTVKM